MNVSRALLAIGTVVAVTLIGRFAIDFARWMPLWLVVPAWGLVAGTSFVAARNVLAREAADRDLKVWERRALIAVVPIGFVGSSLDCMGLSLGGCTTTCALLKTFWFPAMFAVSALAMVAPRRAVLTALLGLSFVALVPHCVCRNPVNAWWMDRIGQSPMCLGWGFVAAVVAIGALLRRTQILASLGVAGAITGGTLAFFVGHHFFRFPW